MLDDGNASGEQQRVRRPAAVADVVDVERVDTDQRRTMGGEPRGAGPGEKVPPFGPAPSASLEAGADADLVAVRVSQHSE